MAAIGALFLSVGILDLVRARAKPGTDPRERAFRKFNALALVAIGILGIAVAVSSAFHQ